MTVALLGQPFSRASSSESRALGLRPNRRAAARTARASSSGSQPCCSLRLTGRPARSRASFHEPNRAVIAFALGHPLAPGTAL
jgi:hypothetical protein